MEIEIKGHVTDFRKSVHVPDFTAQHVPDFMAFTRMSLVSHIPDFTHVPDFDSDYDSINNFCLKLKRLIIFFLNYRQNNVGRKFP
jgi:hypothetical protein